MKEILKFEIQGSAKNIYTVSFWKVEDDLKSACTCPAGKKGIYCKHRLQLLEGDITNFIGENFEDFEELAEFLAGSDIEEILEEFLYLKNSETLYKNYNKMILKTYSFEIEEIELETLEFETIKEKQITIIKYGKICACFDFNFNYIGTFYMDIRNFIKLYPELKGDKIIHDKLLFTTNNENIEKARNFSIKKERMKELREQMKLAMR